MTGTGGKSGRILIPELKSGWKTYLLAAFIIVAVSGICYLAADYIGYQTVSFILLFVVSILSILMGIGPIALASLLSAVIWDFFFIPPKFTITIDRTEDAMMLAMFFIIALVNGILTSRVRRQERLALDRESKTAALYQLTRDLSDAGNLDELKIIAHASIYKSFGVEIDILLQDGNNNLLIPQGVPEADAKMAKSVFANEVKPVNPGHSFSDDRYSFLPLQGRRLRSGIMMVKPPAVFSGEESDFWETFITQISNAVEREFLNDIARKARFLDESDKLYKTLFNSISHELRIPVATILSGSETIYESAKQGVERDISYEILKASHRLNRLIENLLNMSRLESGHIEPRPDWCDVHDLVNKVTDNLTDELKPFDLKISIPDDMPLVFVDFGLMEQVLHNLLYNAIIYSQASREIEVKASYSEGMMCLEVLDRGPGLPEHEIQSIFRKFYRIEGTGSGGTGLGLSIAKGFTEAHKGSISAGNRQGGGAMFIVKIPSDMPTVELTDKNLSK